MPASAGEIADLQILDLRRRQPDIHHESQNQGIFFIQFRKNCTQLGNIRRRWEHLHRVFRALAFLILQ